MSRTDRLGRSSLIATALLLGVSGAAYAGATASSFQKETRLGTNYWNAPSAIDGKLETAWMVPGDSSNKGEYLLIDVPKCTVDKLAIVPGYAKSDNTYTDYARVKSVRVEVFKYNDDNELTPAGPAADLQVADKMEMQILDLPDVAIDDMFGGKVKITVTDVYPGRDYPNMAISEVVVHLTEFEAAAQITGDSGDDPKHMGGDMVDDNTKTYWTSPSEGASIDFKAEGFTLARVGLTPGPSNFARPKKVEVTANGRTVVREVPNAKGTQWIEIPPIQGYTGSAWGAMNLKILEVYPGSGGADTVAIAELDLMATAYEGI